MAEPPIESTGETDLERDDETRDPMFAPEVVEPAVSLLAELASAGPALEFGIGTGRIALPLAARGVDVHGIDLSEAAVARLRSKPRGDRVPVTIGDFSARAVESAPPGSFALVYLVFNTIMNVTTQAGQVAVFRNAAAHLRPDGVFLIETMIPDLQRLPVGERFVPFDVSPDHLGVDEYDLVAQGLVSHHWTRRGDEWESSSGPFRFVWPAELDLMAELAGLRLRHRWASFGRDPLTAESRSHVSVWEKA
ncbi:MAG TPA: class I SAM-dependent methyltransferase [Candidatus Limnocylindrales bacterium]|nr:class I SAM-dependent methyltransferase [Candidatus Limnocylindrales bacterium]